MKYGIKIVLLSMLFVLICIEAVAQKDWTYITPSSQSRSFNYYVGEGDDYDEAIDNVLGQIASQGNVDLSLLRKKKKQIVNLKRSSTRTERLTINFNETSYNIFYVDQVKRDKYYVLYAVAKSGYGIRKNPGKLGNSNFVWRSALAPGWGQFYNKQSGKGLLFSLGELTLIGGTIFAFSEASDSKTQANLALSNGNLSEFNSFDQQRRNWNTTGTILGISSLTLWILNVIDASASDKNLYVINQKKFRTRLIVNNKSIGFGINLSK